MKQYRYSESNIIDQVTFIASERGTPRAYLRASPNVDGTTLYDIECQLQANRMQCIPFMLDGEPVLEVRGFKHDEKFLELLSAKGWTSGPVKEDISKKPVSFLDKVQKRSLQAAGGFYAWGDYNFFMYGLRDASKLDMAAGILYGLPTPVLLAYGKNDQSHYQLKDLSRKLVKHLQEKSLDLPEQCSLHSIIADHKKGLIKHADEVLTRFPSEFMNLCYAAAGACIFTAASKHLTHTKVPPKAVEAWLEHLKTSIPNATKEMAHSKALKSIRVENWLNAGVGISTMTAGLAGAVIEEKVRDPDDPRKSGIQGVWEWVQERPLAIAGGGFILSTLLHAAATVVAMKGQDAHHKKAVWHRASFVGASLIAEVLVAISSKGHGKGVVSDKSVDDSIVAVAADLIVRQPKDLQEELTQYMGKFLGRPDVLALGDEQATDLLRKEVAQMQGNPWAKAEPKNAKDKSPVSVCADKIPGKSWETKTACAPALPPALSL